MFAGTIIISLLCPCGRRLQHQHSFTMDSATSRAGHFLGGAGDRKAGKALDPVFGKIKRQQDGPVPALCGDGDPVTGATVHSHRDHGTLG